MEKYFAVLNFEQHFCVWLTWTPFTRTLACNLHSTGSVHMKYPTTVRHQWGCIFFLLNLNVCFEKYRSALVCCVYRDWRTSAKFITHRNYTPADFCVQILCVINITRKVQEFFCSSVSKCSLSRFHRMLSQPGTHIRFATLQQISIRLLRFSFVTVDSVMKHSAVFY